MFSSPRAQKPHTLTHRSLATLGLLGLLSAGVVVGHSSEALAGPDLACSSGDTSTYGGGTGDPASPFVISTKQHLFLLSERREDLGKHFVQTVDLDIRGCEFTPIGTDTSNRFSQVALTGSYSGSDGVKKITGLTITSADYNAVGLFREIGLLGSAEDLKLVDVRIESSSGEVGGLAGYNYGNISNVEVLSGDISGRDFVGGVVGWNEGDVSGSRSGAGLTVTAVEDSAGGLAGYMDGGSIIDSISHAAVSGNDYVGGFVSLVFGGGEIKRSRATGDVTAAENSVGGFAAEMGGSSLIESSSASGNVTVTAANRFGDIGGFVGGVYSSSNVTSSFATGSVVIEAVAVGATPIGVGGFAGAVDSASFVTVSYSTGNVSAGGSSKVGGFVGGNAGTISDSYSTGTATGGAEVGGFAGNNAGTITNSFWDVDTSGLGAVDSAAGSDGGVGKSTDQMTTFATFSGLDQPWPIVDGWAEFAPNATPAKVWGICSQVEPGYPFLLWQFDSDPCVEPGPGVSPEPGTNVTDEANSGTTTPSAPREKQADSPAIHLDLQGTVGQRVAGTTVVIGGQGLAPGSTMALVVRSTPQTLATGTVSSLGNFSTKISLPALSPGSHTLTLSGTAPDGSLVTLTQGFSVSAEGTFSALGSVAGAQTVGLAVTGPASSLMWSGLGGLGLMLAGLALAAARTGLRIKQSL
jgi:hypothetical protein